MSPVTYKCPNCGGPLTFDAAKQLFDCDYCRGEFSEQYLVQKEQAAARQKADAEQAALTEQAEQAEQQEVVYNCPSCGAELVTSETTAATFCYYCHNPVVLTGRLEKALQPDQVLPFAVPREQAVEKFLAWCGGKRFVPRDFFRQEQIEKISGVYYPYWMADYQGRAHFEGEGVKGGPMSVRGNYQVTERQHYRVVRDAEISFNNVARSALAQADRKLAEAVHPYDMTTARAFSPTYLAGFFAEKRDIESEQVRCGIEQELQGYARDLMRGASGYERLEGETRVEYEQIKYKYCLLPAWVLTYKGGDGKTYYYAMNGQSGRACGILPIDKRKLLLSSALIAAAVTAIIALGGWLLI
ncbi:MAG: TFIIB-type zinc ribbon-containing protein [Clostridia bacterium]|nr:TFIIB-type zinc ribbon-containing protein [Clostridia bacterium]